MSNSNEEHIMEDFIGESKVNILDLINLTGAKEEYEGFFHIINKGESCGQVNLKISFSSDLKNALNNNNSFRFKNTISNMNNENMTQPNKSVVIPSKSYQFIPKHEENYDNNNYSSEQLWNILNNNLVIYLFNYLITRLMLKK